MLNVSVRRLEIMEFSSKFLFINLSISKMEFMNERAALFRETYKVNR